MLVRWYDSDVCGAIHTERKEKVIAGLCRRQSREKRRWSEYLYILKRKEKKSRGRNDLPAYCFAFSSRKAYLDDGQLGNGKRRGSGGASQLLDASKRQRQPLAGQRWSRAHLPVRTRLLGWASWFLFILLLPVVIIPPTS